MTELLQALHEFIVPRPGMIIKDKKSGKYGAVKFFQWKGGTTTHIPVKFDDGTEDSVWITAFARRYDVIEPDSADYQQSKKIASQQKELKEFRQKLGEVLQIISGLERNKRDVTSLVMKQALDYQINNLKDYRDEILRDIRKLTS